MAPATGAFDAPTPRHPWQALGAPGALHAHEGPLQHGRAPYDALARVPAIGPHQLRSREARAQRREHCLGAITLLAPRRRDHPDQQETEHSAHAGALAPTAALAAVIAAAPPCAVVCPVGLSMRPARDSRGRPAAARSSPRQVSGRRSQTPARRPGRKSW